MQRLYSSMLATGLLLLSGLVHGFCTDRWSSPADMVRAFEQIDDIPLCLGNWDGHALKTKGAPPLVHRFDRRYVNRVTGDAVEVTLLAGRPGPVTMETLEFESLSEDCAIKHRSFSFLRGRKTEFCCRDVERDWTSDSSQLRLYWGWRAGSDWVAAPPSPLQCSGQRVLYKLIVTGNLPEADDPLPQDPCLSFLQELLPALNKVLFNEVG